VVSVLLSRRVYLAKWRRKAASTSNSPLPAGDAGIALGVPRALSPVPKDDASWTQHGVERHAER
jgi:hypothetical protein